MTREKANEEQVKQQHNNNNQKSERHPSTAIPKMTEEKEANENQDSNRLQVENENAKNNGNQRFVYAFLESMYITHREANKKKSFVLFVG